MTSLFSVSVEFSFTLSTPSPLCPSVRPSVRPRAVWYDPASYPTSWQLDPTEGPNRERRRLQRCYLTIPNKYLLKDRRKAEGEQDAAPADEGGVLRPLWGPPRLPGPKPFFLTITLTIIYKCIQIILTLFIKNVILHLHCCTVATNSDTKAMPSD